METKRSDIAWLVDESKALVKCALQTWTMVPSWHRWALDNISERHIQQSLGIRSGNQTIVMIAHRLSNCFERAKTKRRLIRAKH